MPESAKLGSNLTFLISERQPLQPAEKAFSYASEGSSQAWVTSLPSDALTVSK